MTNFERLPHKNQINSKSMISITDDTENSFSDAKIKSNTGKFNNSFIILNN